MHIPFTDFINQIQNKQTVANQPNISYDQTVMLITKFATVSRLSRLSIVPLNIADT